MDGSTELIGEEASHCILPSRRAMWGRSLALGLALMFVYSGNRSETIGADDTEAATYLPLAVIRGDGPYLDRFESLLRGRDGRLPVYAAEARGHIVSRYPLGPALLAVPLELPQVLALDRLRPGWDCDPEALRWCCMRMAKVSASLIAALTGVALYHLLWQLGLGRVAVASVLAAALGSDLWTVASQSLWQHGPAALALTVSIMLLLPERRSRARLLLAGLTTAAIVACRLIDAVFACTIALWMTRQSARDLLWFLPFPVLIAVVLFASNLWFFNALTGGQAQLEAMHSKLHGLDGAWSGDVLEGAAGTLLSPSRGLFVFSPWVVVALGSLPVTFGRLRRWSLVVWLLGAIVPLLFLLAKYSVWWAGHSFGPRYWTDAVPVFAILLGFGLDWSRINCRPVFLAFVVTITVSIGLQAIGASCYPSSWNDKPLDVDLHHERLWDWQDCEVLRCLSEGDLDPTRRLRGLAWRTWDAAERRVVARRDRQSHAGPERR